MALTAIAFLTGGALVAIDRAASPDRPDLVFVTFAKDHADAYAPAIAAFERANGVKVSVEVVSQRALQGRLQSALQVGADVPDIVELLGGTLGTFVRGPVGDVGLLDLRERTRAAGLDGRLVNSRFALWSNRGRQFALPHDLHPVMLAYRKDILDRLGIDANALTTWDAFAAAGRRVTGDLDGDGVNDRYMIDLPSDGGDALRLLLLQGGVPMFDGDGNVRFDDPRAVRIVCWYVRQIAGESRIAFPAGWGQTFARSVIDGLCVFYLCPDWRARQLRADVPSVAGRMALMPLPAWDAGGSRTSTWGGTGLAITRRCRDPELAWKLAIALYYNEGSMGSQFARSGVLPPLIDAWTAPEFDRSDPYFSGVAVGRAYAAIAPEVPADPTSTNLIGALAKLSEAFQNVRLHYDRHGDEGLDAYAAGELRRCADRVRAIAARNAFERAGTQAVTR